MQATTTTLTPELESEWADYVRGIRDREPLITVRPVRNADLIDLSEDDLPRQP